MDESAIAALLSGKVAGKSIVRKLSGQFEDLGMPTPEPELRRR